MKSRMTEEDKLSISNTNLSKHSKATLFKQESPDAISISNQEEKLEMPNERFNSNFYSSAVFIGPGAITSNPKLGNVPGATNNDQQ